MPDAPENSTPKPKSRWLEWTLGALIALIVAVAGGTYALAYTLSPLSIRHPVHTHYHFRLILINSGRPVDFGQQPFQTDYNHDICSAALTKQPIHFHDDRDQYGHIHWDGMTGGLLLKNYGWNFIGGLPDTLGYRFDQGLVPQRVPIHGQALPARAAGVNYYIYTGTATDHDQRSWNDFLRRDLKGFFSDTAVIDPSEDAQLKALDMTRADMNDVVGNAVIFVQPDAPTAAQVTSEFQKLKPLPDSPCEG